MSATERASESGKVLAEEITGALVKMEGFTAELANDLEALGKTSPEMLMDVYVLMNQIENGERLSGDYAQDEDGNWTLNGRAISDPTKTDLYAINKKMTDEQKKKAREEYDMRVTKLHSSWQEYNDRHFCKQKSSDTRPYIHLFF